MRQYHPLHPPASQHLSSSKRKGTEDTPTPARPAPVDGDGTGAGIRVQKLLAAAGLGSRREIEAWIAAGRVTVGGGTISLGARARAGEIIAVDGRRVQIGTSPRNPRALILNKPVGEVVSRRDPEGRPTVFGRLPPIHGGKWVAVGRLDLNSSGLLLLTDSGDLANKLMHPSSGFEREYAVRVLGRLDPATRRTLLSGVRLDDGMARFTRIEDSDPRNSASANRWLNVVLAEGRYREVRRMFEAVGLQVSRLVRVRFGPVRLPPDLQPGEFRELDAREIERIEALAGAGPVRARSVVRK